MFTAAGPTPPPGLTSDSMCVCVCEERWIPSPPWALQTAAGGCFLPGRVPTIWGWLSARPVPLRALQPLACSMHAAPCCPAGQLGSPPAPLPCFGASHTPLPWLQALKNSDNHYKNQLKFITSLPRLIWRRWSVGLNGALPFLQLRGLDVCCPMCFEAGLAWVRFCAHGRQMLLLAPLSMALCHPARGGPHHPLWHRSRRCSARVHGFRLLQAASLTLALLP